MLSQLGDVSSLLGNVEAVFTSLRNGRLCESLLSSVLVSGFQVAKRLFDRHRNLKSGNSENWGIAQAVHSCPYPSQPPLGVEMP